MNSTNLTPQAIVTVLDQYIIGQDAAKRAVAVALRTRWRRSQLSEDLRKEIYPKNIILIGPTGVGKTEIARRLAAITGSPFIKVEASKFTEVGYVGRDVESMIRDLVEIGVNMVKEEHKRRVEAEAERHSEERLLDLLLPESPRSFDPTGYTPSETTETEEKSQAKTREKLRKLLRAGKLEDREVEFEIQSNFVGAFEIFSGSGMEEVGMQLKNFTEGMFPKNKQRKKKTIAEARRVLVQEEAQKLIDMDRVIDEALKRVEDQGIIFLDEIDKIAGRNHTQGPDVSREGVQRDLLPVVEGSTVPTKYGLVHTGHILFLAAGAFHTAKPSDLIPELQGRFPIRVELTPLGEEDFVRILTEPQNALLMQYAELLKTEGVKLEFAIESIREIARSAALANDQHENIGARRLHTILELLLEEISFEAPGKTGETYTVTREMVSGKLTDLLKDPALSEYIL